MLFHEHFTFQLFSSFRLLSDKQPSFETKNECSWKFCICCGSNNCCKFLYIFIFWVHFNILNFQTIRSPIAIKCIIAEKKLAALKGSIKGKLCSKIYNASNIPGVNYYLRIYPNGKKVFLRGDVWICLYINVGNESKVNVDGKFRIESAGWNQKLYHEYHKKG